MHKKHIYISIHTCENYVHCHICIWIHVYKYNNIELQYREKERCILVVVGMRIIVKDQTKV